MNTQYSNLKLFGERHMGMVKYMMDEEGISSEKVDAAMKRLSRKFIEAMNEEGLTRGEMVLVVEIFRTRFLDAAAEHLDRADEFDLEEDQT